MLPYSVVHIIFVVSHAYQTEINTSETLRLKKIADTKKRERSGVSENKEWERRFGSKRPGGGIRNVAVEYSVFGKSRVQISVRIESTHMFLLIYFRPSKQITYYLKLRNSRFLSDPSRRQSNYSLIIPSLKVTYFFFSWRHTTHSGCVFYSPLSGFSLLAYEVTWSHTAVDLRLRPRGYWDRQWYI